LTFRGSKDKVLGTSEEVRTESITRAKFPVVNLADRIAVKPLSSVSRTRFFKDNDKKPNLGTRFAYLDESSFTADSTPLRSPVRSVPAGLSDVTLTESTQGGREMPMEALLEPRSGFAELEELIEKEVRLRTCGRVRGLQVRILEGQVVITGRASTYYAKQLVTHAALENADQLYVINDVEVG
jgi:hypothetical protein